MNKSRHIISRFRWNSAFNKRERAAELQEHLSSWSKGQMQKEINIMFDKVCPPDQVWRIQAMELDLGTVDFNMLETELTEKLRDRLYKKLVELAFHGNKDTRINIEIVNEDSSSINMLREFLLTGLLPWSYKNTKGSVNEMLRDQLQNDRRGVIEMLREVSVPHADVRRRIALQIHEPNIISIIKGLEPSNYAQVIDFSHEMTKVQKKETLVQTSISDFRENLWCWILNYLLIERGTLFNKRAFIKSSIGQMAAHYNIGYDELLEGMREAISRMSPGLNVKADFVLMLNVLSEENAGYKTSAPAAEDHGTDFFGRLTDLFKDEKLRRSVQLRAEFNELIISLSRQNRNAFRNLVTEMSNTGHLVPAIKDLKDAAIEIIFTALNPGQAKDLIKRIYFLEQLYGKDEGRRKIWTTGILFLKDHKNVPFTNPDFLNACIAELAKKDHIPVAQLLDRLTNAILPSAAKTLPALDIYTDLNQAFVAEISNGDSAFFEERFTACLNRLHHSEKEQLAAGKETFLKYIRLWPRQALQMLINYPDKKNLQKTVTELLDLNTVKLLIKHTTAEMSTLLFKVKDVLSTLSLDHKVGVLAAWMHDRLMMQSLTLIILDPEYTALQVLEYTLKVLSRLSPSGLSTQWEPLVHSLFSDTRWNGRKDIRVLAATISSSHAVFHMLPVSEQTDRIISLEKAEPAELQRLLILHFTDKQFVTIRKNDTAESERIINYFLSGGKQLMNEQVRMYADMLGKRSVHFSKAGIISQLKELYWKCIIKYSDHHGNAELLKRAYKTAVLHHFPDSDDIHSGNISRQDEQEMYKVIHTTKALLANTMDDKLASAEEDIEELDAHVSMPDPLLLRCENPDLLEDLCAELIREKQVPLWLDLPEELETEDLLKSILVHYPERFLRMLQQETFSDADLRWMNRTLSFKNMIRSVVVLNRDKQVTLSILERFYASLGSLTFKGISGGEIQLLLFKKLIKAWTSNNWKLISTENIWNELIWELALKRGVSKENFIRDLEKVKFHFPVSLQVSLGSLSRSEKMPLQSALRENVIRKREQMLVKPGLPVLTKSGIGIRNAGLVLISSYIPMLFERLDLMADAKNIDKAKCDDAVHYLQYLATGLSYTEESSLPLNKVLCGLPLSTPICNGITVSEASEKMINGLIKAVIGYWSSIGECSINGFRGNWMVREGLLSELEDKWELIVEKRAYDILIQKSPFSFSIIKYPWMHKPLHVYWSY